MVGMVFRARVLATWTPGIASYEVQKSGLSKGSGLLDSAQHAEESTGPAYFGHPVFFSKVKKRNNTVLGIYPAFFGQLDLSGQTLGRSGCEGL